MLLNLFLPLIYNYHLNLKNNFDIKNVINRNRFICLLIFLYIYLLNFKLVNLYIYLDH